jgi:DNA end-binding protein Ku
VKENMATASRAVWSGAISFGLVNIPVSLHPATRPGGVDFDWLDRRTMDPVGYKRVNKATGREVAKDDIVRGVKTEGGRYVVLSEDEIAEVFPKSTRSIDIETFVAATDVPFVYLDRPYYLVPGKGGAKVYALLREALLKTGRIGLARVVLHTKQHLAALVPAGPALVLDLLRWDADMRDLDALDLPAEGEKAAGIGARELAMATRLIDELTGPWEPDKFRDSFRDDVMALVEKKAEAEGEPVEPQEQAPPATGAQVIDLAELLRRSLRGGGKGEESGAGTAKGSAKKTASKAASAAKPPRAATKRRAA